MSAVYDIQHESIQLPDFSEWRSLRFLAARYESAELLLDCLDEHADEEANTTFLTHDEVQRIANLCTEDGSAWGHIPCLGGRFNDYFLRALSATCCA